MEIVVLKDTPTLLSCNIPANYYQGAAITAWSAGTYAQDVLVYRTVDSLDRVYKSLEASNDGTPGEDVRWSYMGPTDRHAMLDLKTTSKSSYEEEITFSFDSGMCDTVGLFGLDALEIDLALSYGGSVIKSETIDLKVAEEASWWSYYFSDYRYKNRAMWRFPFYATSTLTGTIRWKPGLFAQCAVIAIGNTKQIGATLYGVNLGLKSFSVINENDFGTESFIQRGRGKKYALKVYIGKGALAGIYPILESQDARPIILNANNPKSNREQLLSYCFFRDISIDMPGPYHDIGAFKLEDII